jgi:hypothetical protein
MSKARQKAVMALKLREAIVDNVRRTFGCPFFEEFLCSREIWTSLKGHLEVVTSFKSVSSII